MHWQNNLMLLFCRWFWQSQWYRLIMIITIIIIMIDNPSLPIFDDLLRSDISHFTNSTLSDLQWLHASLLIRDGSLGVRRVSAIALPAFMASAASSQSLQTESLTSIWWNDWDMFSHWLSKFSTDPPPEPSSHNNNVVIWWMQANPLCPSSKYYIHELQLPVLIKHPSQ